ncbi:MAG: hypothetical protein AAFX81_13970 [Pseudomonadota bacterium]
MTAEPVRKGLHAREVIAGLLLLLVLAAAGVAYVYWQLDGEISLHGWIALGLGCGATLLLTAGLLVLMFHSHHKGYDDDAGHL